MEEMVLEFAGVMKNFSCCLPLETLDMSHLER